ncbi:helix-hairpin-helix domain-containing protein [Gracilimonas sp.]|uniref:ComEA family DNA-binding protein n=1 Tax=Gracilimonas sp. TaxID=1974203 RepID=UPI0032EC6EAB
MKFNDLKRKAFFWIEKLQISRTERISISILLALLAVLFMLNFFLTKTFNYNQEKYDALTAEFEKRSAQLHQEQKELEQKYNPDLTVNEAKTSDHPNDDEMAASKQDEPVAVEIININTATSQQLQLLDGIGEAYAQRIIEYRKANGGFDSIDELVNVKGIGEKRLENIRPFITLDD